MHSKPINTKTSGIVALSLGVLVVVINSISYTLGEAYWNYGPNDPFTTIIPIVRVVMWILAPICILMGILILRGTEVKRQ
jgi:hypothetical protein